MPGHTHRRRQRGGSINTNAVVACICAVLVISLRSRADEASHVRTESAYIHSVLTEATDRSSTVSALVNRIRTSNVIAHLECAHFTSLTLQGRTLFIVAKKDVRYVRVQLDCQLARQDLMPVIGHELQHVAEIVAAAEVVDQTSFARLLQTIGFSRNGTPEEEHETEAALLTQERVTQEVSKRRRASTFVATRQH